VSISISVGPADPDPEKPSPSCLRCKHNGSGIDTICREGEPEDVGVALNAWLRVAVVVVRGTQRRHKNLRNGTWEKFTICMIAEVLIAYLL